MKADEFFNIVKAQRAAAIEFAHVQPEVEG